MTPGTESLVGALPVLPAGHRWRIKNCRWVEYHYGTTCDLQIVIEKRFWGFLWLKAAEACIGRVVDDRATMIAATERAARQARKQYDDRMAKLDMKEELKGVY